MAEYASLMRQVTSWSYCLGLVMLSALRGKSPAAVGIAAMVCMVGIGLGIAGVAAGEGAYGAAAAASAGTIGDIAVFVKAIGSLIGVFIH